MHSQFTVLATFAFAIVVAVAKPLVPPATGWLHEGYRGQLIFPLTATQCEPFDIFYNTTFEYVFDFTDTYTQGGIFFIEIPEGVGYMEWICNVPAGLAFTTNFDLHYVVQPGSSSACLGDLSTTYSLLDYVTTNFVSYTQPHSLPTGPITTTLLQTTTSFPTGAFSTITLNPNLAVGPTTSSLSSSTSSPTSLSSPTPSHKSLSSSVVGGIVGSVAFVLLILALVFVLLRWRKRIHPLLSRVSSIEPPAACTPCLGVTELEPTYLSSPIKSSGPESVLRSSTSQNPFSPPSPCNHGNEPMSDVGAIEPEASQYSPPFSTLIGQRRCQDAIAPLEARRVLPSEQSPDSECRSSLYKSSSDLALHVLPSADREPPCAHSDAPATEAPATLSDGVPLFSQSSTNVTQEGSVGLSAILEAISRAQLSQRERQAITSFNNLLIEDPSVPPDSRSQSTHEPPPYTG